MKVLSSLGKVIQIGESQIQAHLNRLVLGMVEDTLNGLLDAEAEWLVDAGRYEREKDHQGY